MSGKQIIEIEVRQIEWPATPEVNGKRNAGRGRLLGGDTVFRYFPLNRTDDQLLHRRSTQCSRSLGPAEKSVGQIDSRPHIYI